MNLTHLLPPCIYYYYIEERREDKTPTTDEGKTVCVFSLVVNTEDVLLIRLFTSVYEYLCMNE
jgi:hypothetical protein